MQDKTQEVLQIAKRVFKEEVEGISQVCENLDEVFISVIRLILQCRGKVIVTGMGKSGHIASKIAATLASTGTPSFFVHPAEAIHGDLGMIESHDVLIAISYSGESDEILTILPAIRLKKIVVIAITGDKSSTLAKLADYVLDVNVEKEACPLNLAPTTSTSASLVMGDAIAISLLELRGFKSEDFALSHPGGSLGRRLLTRVCDIMHSGARLPIISPDNSLKEVVLEISRYGLGIVAVVDKNRKVLGVITDGDVRRALDRNVDFLTTSAVEIMNMSPKLLSDNDMASVAVELMERHKITAFLVVDDDKRLVGAFNLHDLFKAKLI